MQTRNIARGALLFGGLALAIFALWYYAAVSLNLPEPATDTPRAARESGKEAGDELNLFFVIVPTLAGLLCGGVLGWFAGRFETSRYLKLLGAALILYFLAAWISGGALVVANAIRSDQIEAAGAILLEILKAGVFGALILSPICGPLIIALVFVLERVTQTTRGE